MKTLSQITVTTIHGGLMVSSNRGRYLKMKSRHSYAISFCKSGQIDYLQNGIRIASTPEYAVLLPKNATYELFGVEDGIFPLINFDTLIPFADAITAIPLTNAESYYKDLERICELWLYPEKHAKVMSLLYDILQRLSMESNEASPLLTPALRYLDEHIFDPNLRNSILAKQANISEIYFRRLFYQAYGMTPKQYILELRLRQARHLLAGNRQTVSSIAESCGFSSVYHFSRAFKDATGISPAEYAKRTELY